VIIPYTANDVRNWTKMFKRCYDIAGVTKLDRVQITPGYGLWTAGIGFQAGAELLGAMAVPMGPGNTEKQIKMMLDLHTTVLCSTASYALVLSETVSERKLKNKINLKKGIIGSERWSDKTRKKISSGLGIELFDIYGLTEIYGPGISIDCPCHEGLHYFDDFLYFEIIDPETVKNLPNGQMGELVITTLLKEGAPLIRYRTRDLTVLKENPCSCGSQYPLHERIFARTDDMVKVKGVNIYPGQIDELLKNIPEASGEYSIHIDHTGSRDTLLLKFEIENGADASVLNEICIRDFKAKIGIKVETQALPVGSLPRSEKKTKRVFDNRI
jgi:phenylacetate-CoA ligase